MSWIVNDLEPTSALPYGIHSRCEIIHFDMQVSDTSILHVKSSLNKDSVRYGSVRCAKVKATT
jgi:hypothetical protein